MAIKKNEWINDDLINKEKADNAEKIPGQTNELYERTHNEFEMSDDSKVNYDNVEQQKNNLNTLVNKEEIISSDVKDKMNSSFEVPNTVTKADKYLSSQLQKIQSGRTSYTDQVQEMMDKIMNRDKFSYDVDNDPLFQQALASAMNSGKQAMQDTIGQASALTGGYGSTYATSAGNQAYNSFIEDAYDNLPQYYQMALEAYQMEGEEMYRQFGVVSEMDDKEFNRNVAAYDATYQHRNQMYNEAYGQFRDEKSDAFATANLQLNEHGQRVNDAYNLYNAELNYADSMYEKEYTKWAKETELLYDNYWNEKNFDEGVRQYEQSFAEDVRQFDTNFTEQQRQYNESLAEQKRQHNEQMSYNWASLNKKSSGGSDGTTKLSNGASVTTMATYKQKALKEYNEGGIDAVNNYLNSLGINDEEWAEISNYLFGDADNDGSATSSLYSQDFYKVKDTYNNLGGWFAARLPGGSNGYDKTETDIDKNDVVAYKDSKGVEHKYTLSELGDALREAGVNEKDINAKLLELTNLRR